MSEPDVPGPRFPELGFYTLTGGAQNPFDLVTECRQAEELGLGAVCRDASPMSEATGYGPFAHRGREERVRSWWTPR